jgi:glutamyl-tRNA reductase
VRLARSEVPSLASARVLVLGAGETGAVVARLLRKAGVRAIVIANRSEAAARRLATELGAEAAPLDRVGDLIADADVVFGAAANVGSLVDVEELRAVARGREPGAGPLYLFDVAHPRNFPPEVGELPGVVHRDLEDVFVRVARARAAKAENAPAAEAIAREGAEAFERWLRSRANVAVLRATRELVLARAAREADRLGRGATSEERERYRVLARAVARSLLHAPTMALRKADATTPEGRSLMETAAALFALGGTATER